MFLTRLGFNSKAVITGDITQIDLPQGKKSGLIEALEFAARLTGSPWCNWGEGRCAAQPGAADYRAYEEYDVDHPQRGGNAANGKAAAPARDPGKEREKESSRDELLSVRPRSGQFSW